MERVIAAGTDESAPSFYFNYIDAALLQHYCGEVPEDFSCGITVTDELEQGEVAIEGGEGLSDEARAAFVSYWENGMAHVAMLNDVEVAMARKGLADDEPAVAMVTDEGVVVMSADEFMDLADDKGDDDYVIEFTPDEG